MGSKNYPSEVSLSVAGSQGTQTEYLMDGADNTDSFSNVNLPFPFPDAIQEFSVQTSGLSAQYGFHPGSVVNIVARSGGNAFHGTVFDFLRNNSFNATNYFSTRDTLKRHQFGGTIGGPIVKDRLFFFGGYQGTIVHEQSNNTTYIRSPPPPTGTIFFGPPNSNTEHQVIGRVDWNKSSKQTIFGCYYITHYSQPGFFNNNLLNTSNPQLNDQEQSATLGHTYSITSNLVNLSAVARSQA